MTEAWANRDSEWVAAETNRILRERAADERGRSRQRESDNFGYSGYKIETMDSIVATGQEERGKHWLIKGVIAEGETSAWIAPPGGMKSALMAQLAICVSDGHDWNGKKHRGSLRTVVYFALERADLVRRRLRAHFARLNYQPEDGDFPGIVLVSAMIDMTTPEGVKKVIQTIDAAGDEIGMPVSLIIFDTFAKLIAAGGGDEDKAKDQGKVFANIQRVKEALSGRPHVAIVGHTGKDETRGSRGSNAILGDADVMVMISGDTVKTATVTKANDAPEGPLFSFKSIVHEFGLDEDGDPITVNIVSNEDISIQSAPKGREPKLTPDQKTMFSILHAAGAAGLTTEEWNAGAKEAGMGISRRAKLFDLRMALQGKKLVREYADRWTVNHG